MTEPSRPRTLSGLKAHAESTLFRDWRVTPELKARLDQRIRTRGRKPARPWLMPATAVAAALCLLVISGAWLMDRALPGQEPPAPTHAVAVADASASATLPPLTPPAPAAPSDAIQLSGGTVQLTVVPKTIIGTVTDGRGSNVTFSSTTAANGATALQDQYGNALANTVGAGIPGVEAHPGQKIVLNADYSLAVADAQAALSSLQQMTTAAGGYVVEATLAKGNDDSYLGRLVLRIPAGAYTGAVDRVRQAGRVTQERQWTQDVTDRYEDLQARITLLQEMQRKLEELALKAATFNDWLQLARQLNETRAQIEQMQGSLKQLDNQIAYSTLTIQLHQAAPGAIEPPVAPAEAGLGQQLGRTFIHSMGALGHLATATLMAITAAIPFALPVLLVGAVGVWLWRRKRKE